METTKKKYKYEVNVVLFAKNKKTELQKQNYDECLNKQIAKIECLKIENVKSTMNNERQNVFRIMLKKRIFLITHVYICAFFFQKISIEIAFHFFSIFKHR